MDPLEFITQQLEAAGYEVTVEFGLRRINGGHELTEMQFQQVARELLSEQ